MPEGISPRKLVAVLAADVFGYSRLMQADDQATLRASRPPLSIVVLPFDNLSGDPEQGYLADAITDDFTTDLSRIAGSFARVLR